MTNLKTLIISLIATAMISSSAMAGSFGFGATGNWAVVSGTGTETDADGTTDTSNRNATTTNTAIIASYFAEYIFDNGWVLGFEGVPGSADVNDKKLTRTDANPLAQVPADTADDIARSAQAEISNVYTYYVDIPLGGNGIYAKAGLTQMDVTTQETTRSGVTYGNASVDGTLIGLGYTNDLGSNAYYKIEGSHTGFDTINLTSSESDKGNKVSADLDVTKLTIALGYKF